MLRALAVIALVLLVLLLAIPLGVGMGMAACCPECQGALGGVALCLAVLATLMIVVLGFREVAPATRSSSRLLLLARSLERPPQPLAFV